MPQEVEPTKPELQEQAEKLGVPKSGTKEEIAERVADAEASGSADVFAPAPYTEVRSPEGEVKSIQP
jgi:hypothetical protein